jgi:hypothetical protein
MRSARVGLRGGAAGPAAFAGAADFAGPAAFGGPAACGGAASFAGAAAFGGRFPAGRDAEEERPCGRFLPRVFFAMER